MKNSVAQTHRILLMTWWCITVERDLGIWFMSMYGIYYSWYHIYIDFIFALSCHQCRGVLSSFYVSACLSVCPSWTMLLLYLFSPGFSYWPEIWWNDAQYHRVDRYIKWPCLPNLCAFHGTLKFTMTGLHQVWGMMTHIRKCEEITLWLENWWHDAIYHEGDHSLKWPCFGNVHISWSRLAEGAVILQMSCLNLFALLMWDIFMKFLLYVCVCVFLSRLPMYEETLYSLCCIAYRVSFAFRFDWSQVRWLLKLLFHTQSLSWWSWLIDSGIEFNTLTHWPLGVVLIILKV